MKSSNVFSSNGQNLNENEFQYHMCSDVSYSLKISMQKIVFVPTNIYIVMTIQNSNIFAFIDNIVVKITLVVISYVV